MQSEFEKTFKQHKAALTAELTKLGKQKQVQLVEWDIEQNKTDYEDYFTAGWQAAKAESHKQAALYQFEINHLAQANEQWREKAVKAQTGPINNTTIVAVERMVEQQVKASGVTADVFRLDGEKILNAAVEAARGGK